MWVNHPPTASAAAAAVRVSSHCDHQAKRRARLSMGHDGNRGMVKRNKGEGGGGGKQIKDAAKSITRVFKVPGHHNTANRA